MQTGDPALVWVSLVIGLGLLYGVICAPLAAFWAALFDTRIRYTAIGTIYQVSGIVASGLTPRIGAWLVARNGGQPWLLATYAVAVSLVSLLCMRGLPETHGRELVADLQAGTPSQARTAAAREHEDAAA